MPRPHGTRDTADRRRGRLVRHLLRLPAWLYRLRLGWLLGHRFLLLTHRGRRSGRRRQTVLEVVQHDVVAGVYVVASRRGEHADWLLNVTRHPEVDITVGTRRLAVIACRVDPAEAAAILAGHAARHPRVFPLVTRMLMGRRARPTHADGETLAAIVPLIALRARPARRTSTRRDRRKRSVGSRRGLVACRVA